jgi:hypothetical protein
MADLGRLPAFQADAKRPTDQATRRFGPSEVSLFRNKSAILGLSGMVVDELAIRSI